MLYFSYAFLAPVSLILTLTNCTQSIATVQILSIKDTFTNKPIPNANIFVQPEDLGPGEDGGIFKNVTPPIVIPIEMGKCTYVLIEVDSYKYWEQAICPSKAENVLLNVRLVPIKDLPPGQQEG